MPRRLLTRPNKVGVSTRKLWPGIPCVNCRAESGVLSLKKGRGVHGDLPVHRRQHLGSDVSLAPSGERSLQGMVLMHAGAVLMWETGTPTVYYIQYRRVRTPQDTAKVR